MSLVQSIVANSAATPSTSPAAAWPGATTAANILVAVIGCRGSGAAHPTITLPSPWVALTVRGETAVSYQDPGLRIFYLTNAASRSGTETATLSASVDWVMYLAEYAAASTWIFDVEAGTQDSVGATSGNGGSLTPAGANEIILAFIANRNQGTVQNATPGDGFTRLGQSATSNATAGNGLNLGYYENLAHAASAVNCTTSFSLTRQWSGATVAFKNVGSSPPGNSVAPAVTGTAVQGNVLTSTQGTWTNTPTSYAYQWMHETAVGSGVYANISSATASTYTLVASDGGLHVKCAVTATNGTGSTSQDSNTVLIDTAPIANAGTDQINIEPGATVTLNGTGSTDSDGSVASYAWTQTSGTAATLSSASAASPTFTAPAAVTASDLIFSLVVTDNQGAPSVADTVQISVLANASALTWDTGTSSWIAKTVQTWSGSAWI